MEFSFRDLVPTVGKEAINYSETLTLLSQRHGVALQKTVNLKGFVYCFRSRDNKKYLADWCRGK
jgi:hypothetical protein